jgi:hypothetical protein
MLSGELYPAHAKNYCHSYNKHVQYLLIAFLQGVLNVFIFFGWHKMGRRGVHLNVNKQFKGDVGCLADERQVYQGVFSV